MTTTSQASEKRPRIGWIGTGVMGLSMCGHVLAKGYAVTVSTRTKSRAQPLLDKGAAWADTPCGAAPACALVQQGAGAVMFRYLVTRGGEGGAMSVT